MQPELSLTNEKRLEYLNGAFSPEDQDMIGADYNTPYGIVTVTRGDDGYWRVKLHGAEETCLYDPSGEPFGEPHRSMRNGDKFLPHLIEQNFISATSKSRPL